MGMGMATNVLEYWVPAFAGTTAESHCFTSSQDEVGMERFTSSYAGTTPREPVW
jgi:hypothetical protein